MRTRASFFALIPLAACVVFAGVGVWSAGGASTPINPADVILGPERVAVLGTAYVLALVVCLRNLDPWLALLRRQWPYLILLAYILASASWSLFPRKVLFDWIHFVGHTLVAAAAAFHLVRNPQRIAAVVAVGCALVIALSIPVSTLLPGVGTDVMTGRWQGITGNSNTLGLICLLSLWACLAGWNLHRGGWARLMFLCLAAMTLVALRGSGSITAMVASGFVALTMPVLQRLSAASPTGRTGLMAGILFATTSIVLALLAFVPALLQPDALLADLGRDTSLTGRLPLWAFAMDKFHEKPLAGWGFDSLMSVLSTSDFGYGQLHNGYLDLLVRGGVLGLSLALFVVLRTLYLALAQLRYRHGLGPALLTLILAILLHNISEASLFRAGSINSLLIVLSYTLLELYALSPVVPAMSPLNETCRPHSTHPPALPNFLR